MPPSGKWAIAIHGGAGDISRTIDPQPYKQGLQASLDAAYNVLDTGYDKTTLWAQHGVALPSVPLLAALAAVETMEQDVHFNAGTGASLNEHGLVENEASVMDGASMKLGAVCGLLSVVLPSRLAAVVYSASKFKFLGFSAAERYADKFSTLIERKDPSYFITEHRKRILAKVQKGEADILEHVGGTEQATSSGTATSRIPREGETVGATVCDGKGNVACVTSTGGVTNKCDGRIGDTPVIGAGSYASNKSCAISGTGFGEQFLRFSGASRVCFGVELGGLSLSDAVHDVVHNVFPEDTGGFVSVSNSGEIVMDFNSQAMFHGCRNWMGREEVGIWK